ncbi:tRNA(Met) cytidine acetyltransferase TmcA [Vibrio crassostreae]|uniref:tRNA(Met) cytidine acetyltransferase TmcA n=1 Tax=Vibrio crassostreae TaxID=246167 RepID=UPI00148E17E7|nr:GNAT family N-acetyltransferase [Vibrio crassostreae]NOH75005.1 tRNA(Met) cytidine acetyltransferase [Vibrio crassostreae]CAK2449559.1 tRNA(Met) cytidine acetyltransferase TmcA [Vibrio crassostreae]CAK2716855.1 tRNA(Met) cytidine acetyltransferase TmcA [Vibrio crassostreae]CAK3324953.1 tRNA(Met) cytidine acetyltransferase TmcA [Vibrio crassostreae]
MTNPTNTFLNTLSYIAQHNDHRYGVVFDGDSDWQNSTVITFLQYADSQTVFQIGGTPFEGAIHASVKKGQQLLGRECQVLVCDFREQFDANGFSAALGSLIGGGLLLVLPPKVDDSEDSECFGQSWLKLHFDKLLSVSQRDEQAGVIEAVNSLPQKLNDEDNSIDRFEQQKIAVELVKKVVTGHRKRPLILTADRGRGKSSTLGIAAAQLLAERQGLNIIVTAPSVKAVEPVFTHALQRLDACEVINATHIGYQDGSLRFVAPDELLKSKPDCDLLLVDEAAAIPIPMLKSMVGSYHRMVFSTTVHGYEGSGRGFGIKFEAWLSEHRPGWKGYKLEQPIRWNHNDPLERWLFDCFLLGEDACPSESAVDESEDFSGDVLNQLSLVELSKADCLVNPQKLQQCFSLLVDAHYQTSPNDLMQFLDNPAIHLFAAWQQDECLGCMLVTEEGGLDKELIAQVQVGKRRPQGHLAPVLLANQLGFVEAATSRCLRVMRIAVSTRHQGLGIGRWMLEQLSEQAVQTGQVDYLATSFGATSDLISFWRDSEFVPVHIGHQRDQASGCHSVLMVKALNSNSQSWINQVQNHFERSYCFLVSGSLVSLETDMVRALLPKSVQTVSEFETQLVRNYVNGGNSYDAISFSVLNLILLSNDREASVSDLLIAKVVQQKEWEICVEQFNLVGRKQAESQFRKDVGALLANLQCK